MTLYLVLGGFLALCALVWWLYSRGRGAGRQEAVNDALEAHSEARDAQLDEANNRRPGDAVRRLRDGSF